MIYYNLASVVDIGVEDILEIIDVVPNTTVILEPGTQYIKTSALAAEKIQESLAQGMRVAVRKGITTEITIPDLMTKEAQSPMEFATIVARSRLHDLFTDTLLVGNLIQYYKFIEINNRLMAEGYYIHNGNREEVYIKIIESGDQQLIDDLEEYLNTKDLFNILAWKINKINEFEVESAKAETEAEAQIIGKKYYEILLEEEPVEQRWYELPAIQATAVDGTTK